MKATRHQKRSWVVGRSLYGSRLVAFLLILTSLTTWTAPAGASPEPPSASLRTGFDPVRPEHSRRTNVAQGRLCRRTLRQTGLEESKERGALAKELLAGLEEETFQELEGAIRETWSVKKFQVRIEGEANKGAGVWVRYKGVGGFVPNRLFLYSSGKPVPEADRHAWVSENKGRYFPAYPVELSDEAHHKTERPAFFGLIIPDPPPGKLPQVNTPQEILKVPAMFRILMDRSKGGRRPAKFLFWLQNQGVDPRPLIIEWFSVPSEWEGLMQRHRREIVRWMAKHRTPPLKGVGMFKFFKEVATRRETIGWPDFISTRSWAAFGMQLEAEGEEIPIRQALEKETLAVVQGLWEKMRTSLGLEVVTDVRDRLVQIAERMRIPEAKTWAQSVSSAAGPSLQLSTGLEEQQERVLQKLEAIAQAWPDIRTRVPVVIEGVANGLGDKPSGVSVHYVDPEMGVTVYGYIDFQSLFRGEYSLFYRKTRIDWVKANIGKTIEVQPIRVDRNFPRPALFSAQVDFSEELFRLQLFNSRHRRAEVEFLKRLTGYLRENHPLLFDWLLNWRQDRSAWDQLSLSQREGILRWFAYYAEYHPKVASSNVHMFEFFHDVASDPVEYLGTRTWAFRGMAFTRLPHRLSEIYAMADRLWRESFRKKEYGHLHRQSVRTVMQILETPEAAAWLEHHPEKVAISAAGLEEKKLPGQENSAVVKVVFHHDKKNQKLVTLDETGQAWVRSWEGEKPFPRPMTLEGAFAAAFSGTGSDLLLVSPTMVERLNIPYYHFGEKKRIDPTIRSFTFQDNAGNPYTLPVPSLLRYPSSAAFSPGRTLIAIGGDGNRPDLILQNLDPTNEGYPDTKREGVLRRRWTLRTKTGYPTAPSFLPTRNPVPRRFKNGTVLAVGTTRGTVEIWDVRGLTTAGELTASDPAFVLKGHTGEVTSVLFGPHARRERLTRLASADEKGGVRVWTGAKDGNGYVPHQGRHTGQDRVVALAFSPDGGMLASAGERGEIDFWNTADLARRDPEEGLPIVAVRPVGQGVLSLRFQPDGKKVAVGLRQGAILIDAPPTAGLEEKPQPVRSDTHLLPGSLLLTKGVLAAVAAERKAGEPAKIKIVGNMHAQVSELAISTRDLPSYSFLPPPPPIPADQEKTVTSPENLKPGFLLIPNPHVPEIRGTITALEPTAAVDVPYVRMQPLGPDGAPISEEKWFWVSWLERQGARVVEAQPKATAPTTEQATPTTAGLEEKVTRLGFSIYAHPNQDRPEGTPQSDQYAMINLDKRGVAWLRADDIQGRQAQLDIYAPVEVLVYPEEIWNRQVWSSVMNKGGAESPEAQKFLMGLRKDRPEWERQSRAPEQRLIFYDTNRWREVARVAVVRLKYGHANRIEFGFAAPRYVQIDRYRRYVRRQQERGLPAIVPPPYPTAGLEETPPVRILEDTIGSFGSFTLRTVPRGEDPVPGGSLPIVVSHPEQILRIQTTFLAGGAENFTLEHPMVSDRAESWRRAVERHHRWVALFERTPNASPGGLRGEIYEILYASPQPLPVASPTEPSTAGLEEVLQERIQWLKQARLVDLLRWLHSPETQTEELIELLQQSEIPWANSSLRFHIRRELMRRFAERERIQILEGLFKELEISRHRPGLAQSTGSLLHRDVSLFLSWMTQPPVEAGSPSVAERAQQALGALAQQQDSEQRLVPIRETLNWLVNLTSRSEGWRRTTPTLKSLQAALPAQGQIPSPPGTSTPRSGLEEWQEIPLSKLPPGLWRDLEAFGGLRLSRLDYLVIRNPDRGQPIRPPLEQEGAIPAIPMSVNQDLGSILFGGEGKGRKVMADGNAVFLGFQSLIDYTRQHPDEAFLVLGDEGERDASIALRVGSIFFRGEIIEFKYQEKWGPGREDITHLRVRLRELLALRDERAPRGVKLRGVIGDALEDTNDFVRGKENSWAVVAIVDLPQTPEGIDGLSLISDSGVRVYGWMYHAPKPAQNLSPFDPPQVGFEKIAQAHGVSPKDTVALGKFMSQWRQDTLHGNRLPLEPDREGGRKLERHFNGFETNYMDDGDLVPAIFAAMGTSVRGHYVAKKSKSGVNEAEIAEVAAGNLAEAQFAHVDLPNDNTGEADILDPNISYQPTVKEREELERFGSLSRLMKIRTKQSHPPRTGVVAISAVTGASEKLAGERAKFLKEVEFRPDLEGPGGKVIVHTLVLARDGSAYVVRSTFRSDNLRETKDDLKFASSRPTPVPTPLEKPQVEIRRLRELGPYVAEENWLSVDTDPDREVYRNRRYQLEKHLSNVMAEKEIDYHETSLYGGRIGHGEGTEYHGTAGHRHTEEVAELAEVLEGRGEVHLWLTSPEDESLILDAFHFPVEPGTQFFIPARYHHKTVSTEDDPDKPLIITTWLKKGVGLDYRAVEERHGGPWYSGPEGKRQNPNYKNVPEPDRAIRRPNVEYLKSLGLLPDRSVWNLARTNEEVFLNIMDLLRVENHPALTVDKLFIPAAGLEQGPLQFLIISDHKPTREMLEKAVPVWIRGAQRPRNPKFVLHTSFANISAGGNPADGLFVFHRVATVAEAQGLEDFVEKLVKEQKGYQNVPIILIVSAANDDAYDSAYAPLYYMKNGRKITDYYLHNENPKPKEGPPISQPVPSEERVTKLLDQLYETSLESAKTKTRVPGQSTLPAQSPKLPIGAPASPSASGTIRTPLMPITSAQPAVPQAAAPAPASPSPATPSVPASQAVPKEKKIEFDSKKGVFLPDTPEFTLMRAAYIYHTSQSEPERQEINEHLRPLKPIPLKADEEDLPDKVHQLLSTSVSEAELADLLDLFLNEQPAEEKDRILLWRRVQRLILMVQSLRGGEIATHLGVLESARNMLNAIIGGMDENEAADRRFLDRPRGRNETPPQYWNSVARPILSSLGYLAQATYRKGSISGSDDVGELFKATKRLKKEIDSVLDQKAVLGQMKIDKTLRRRWNSELPELKKFSDLLGVALILYYQNVEVGGKQLKINNIHKEIFNKAANPPIRPILSPIILEDSVGRMGVLTVPVDKDRHVVYNEMERVGYVTSVYPFTSYSSGLQRLKPDQAFSFQREVVELLQKGQKEAKETGADLSEAIKAKLEQLQAGLEEKQDRQLRLAWERYERTLGKVIDNSGLPDNSEFEGLRKEEQQAEEALYQTLQKVVGPSQQVKLSRRWQAFTRARGALSDAPSDSKKQEAFEQAEKSLNALVSKNRSAAGLEEVVAEGVLQGRQGRGLAVAVFRRPEDVGKDQADEVMGLWKAAVNKKRPFVIGLATGATPEPLLAELASRLGSLGISDHQDYLQRLYIVAMDDIVDRKTGRNVRPEENEHSAYRYFKERLFDRVTGMSESWVKMHLVVPTVGKVTDQVEQVRSLGGVAWQLMATDPEEGHVAQVHPGERFRDPLIDPDRKNHPRELTPAFLKHNPWAEDYMGITFTLDDFADMMAPEGVVRFSVFGEEKAPMVEQFFVDGQYESARPITFLWPDPMVSRTQVQLDEAAASRILPRLQAAGLETPTLDLSKAVILSFDLAAGPPLVAYLKGFRADVFVVAPTPRDADIQLQRGVTADRLIGVVNKSWNEADYRRVHSSIRSFVSADPGVANWGSRVIDYISNWVAAPDRKVYAIYDATSLDDVLGEILGVPDRVVEAITRARTENAQVLAEMK